VAIHRAPHIPECFTVVVTRIRAFYAFSPIPLNCHFGSVFDKDGSESVKNKRRAISSAK
jgi:hypothetical protein